MLQLNSEMEQRGNEEEPAFSREGKALEEAASRV